MWLAFDIGTTGTKAALITDEGAIVHSAYRAYETRQGGDGVMEQDADDWWRAAVEVTHELDTRDVKAVAITGQMQDLILVDEIGKPVRLVILYSDTRAVFEANSVLDVISAESLYALTGNEQGAGSLLAKLLWLKQHKSGSLQKAHRLLVGAADFIALKMTGNAVSDTTTASTTGLLDLENRRWLSDATFAQLGLEFVPRLLPDMRGGGELAGTLHVDAAAQLGLAAGIPVYHGPGDAGATTLGVGSGEPGKPYGYIGTSGWVGYTSDQCGTPETGVFTLAHPAANTYICVAPILTAGGNLDWAKTTFGYQSYEAMIEAAFARQPTSLIYLPYLSGERSPFSDPFARGAFIGLNGTHTTDDLARAVLEGVVYAYRHALDALINAPMESLTLTGGGTRSLAWCQLFADAAHLRVQTAADAANVGVRGAVIAAQVASGQLTRYAPENWFATNAVLHPRAEESPRHDALYTLFREAYPALKSIFSRMAS